MKAPEHFRRPKAHFGGVLAASIYSLRQKRQDTNAGQQLTRADDWYTGSLARAEVAATHAPLTS